MSNLVIVPARGGSKGVPMKNIKHLHGRPLIYYTLDAATGLASPEDICITTDDDAIIEAVCAYGLEVPFKRPAHLASDQAGLRETLLHAVDHYEKLGRHYDTITLLQPTSPFRTARHASEALAIYTADADMVVSVKETNSNPYYVLFEENRDGFLHKSKSGNFVRRQDCPQVWEYNGAIYVINIASLKEKEITDFTRIRKYVMDEMTSVDIDTPLDWMIASLLASKTD